MPSPATKIGTMTDDKYLLLKQCFRDAQHIVKTLSDITGELGGWWKSWSNNEDFHQTITRIATALFHERCAHPATTETMKQLMIGGEEARQVADELKGQYQELSDIMSQVEKANGELAGIREQIATQRSVKYFKDTVGDVAHDQLMKQGFFEVKAKNGAVYKISRDGGIAKFILSFSGKWKMAWHGRIDQSDLNLPMPDALSTIYAHIIKNPDKFDEEKGCGNIHVKNE